MLSLEEIKEWADTIEAESTLKLIKFCHKPAKPAGRAVTQIVFGDGGDEYRVRIFREFNILYVDAFHKGVEADSKLFRGPITRRSLKSISRILRQLQQRRCEYCPAAKRRAFRHPGLRVEDYCYFSSQPRRECHQLECWGATH